jgi:ATP-dependent Clp protease ATP-binding subunit ClpC
MATLHVRNVPEPLYEALRRCAEENGRSIGAQAVALLNESLSTGRRGFPFFGRPATQLRSCADEPRAAIVDAQAIVRELGHDHVGSEHILLALLSNRASAVARILAAPPYELQPEAVRARLERGPGVPKGTIPFGPDAKKALELALRESLKMRSPAIESTHLLLGIAEAGGRGAEILAELGMSADGLRLAALTIPPPRPLPAFRVVELEGNAEEWAEQLNDACDGPYELVEIVGSRAVFALRRP